MILMLGFDDEIEVLRVKGGATLHCLRRTRMIRSPVQSN